jgi:hypothetical protein
MLVGTRKRNKAVEFREDVVLNAGVGVFVDGHGGGCMGNEEGQQAALHLALLDELGYLGRDIDQLRSTMGANVKLVVTHDMLLGGEIKSIIRV